MPIARNHHIQALRGVAASLVVLSHSLDVLVEHGILPLWFRPVGFSIGGLGVSTFFVISGFIMTTISYDDFGHAAKAISFAKRRLIRIVPTYWIATFLAFTLYQMVPSQHPTILELAKSLTFIPYATVSLGDMQPVLKQGWTLNYEMFFYSIFTLALFLPRRFGLTAVFLAFIGIVVGGSLFKPLSDSTPAQTVFTFLADPIILLFASGIVIGVLKQKFEWYIRYPFWIALSVLALQIGYNIAFEVPSRLPFPQVLSIWVSGIIAVGMCAFAVPSHAGRFESVAEAMGDASYSTYLFHIFVVVALKMVFPINAMTAVFFVLLAVILSNVFGLVFYQTIERPISSMFRPKRSNILALRST